jgi:isopropylmalate/homocitrate/citramalate synthase
MAPHKPVVGSMAFSLESGMGIDVIQEHPIVIFSICPDFVG